MSGMNCCLCLAIRIAIVTIRMSPDGSKLFIASVITSSCYPAGPMNTLAWLDHHLQLGGWGSIPCSECLNALKLVQMIEVVPPGSRRILQNQDFFKLQLGISKG